MIASRAPLPLRGVNVVLRRDGSEIHLDDIETAAQGQAILDEIDAAILAIEDQVDNDDGRNGQDWRSRANTALKKKRRIRPALQKRIADLRRSERQAAALAQPVKDIRVGPEARRTAFINAAEELLDAEVFTEIWARAAERNPAAFAGKEARDA